MSTVPASSSRMTDTYRSKVGSPLGLPKKPPPMSIQSRSRPMDARRTARFDDKLRAIDVDGSGGLSADDAYVRTESRIAAGPAEEAPADVDPVEVEAHG